MSSALLTLDEALATMLADVERLPAREDERMDTAMALGRVLAEDVRATLDVPPANNSAMDGYAVRAADVPQAGTVLPVSLRVPAGAAPPPLMPGTAARIFTGAVIPSGADAVVMQEQCEVAAAPGPGLGERVRIGIVPQPGLAIRRRGEDVTAGAVMLAAGERLGAGALGLAASVGVATLRVARRPRVALFSTGDELVMPGQPLRLGAIYNTNRYTLMGLLQGLGCDVTDLGIVADDLEATRTALRQAAAGHDLLVTSGGVSVGEEDHLRPAVRAEGTLQEWKVAIKPGKPLAFGAIRRPHDAGQAWFIGLPGNPVASFVTAVLAVRPLVLRLQGRLALQPVAYTMRADFDGPRADVRREFLRVRVNARGGLDLYPHQGSGVLSSVAWADGLVDNPPGTVIRRGDGVRYLPLAALTS